MTRKLLNIVCFNILIFNLLACSNPQSATKPTEPPALTEDGDVASSDDSADSVESDISSESTTAGDDSSVDTSPSDGEPSSDTDPDVVEEEDESVSVDAARRSPGCDNLNFNGSSTERFLSIDGVDRRYQVRLPIDYDPSQAYPMLFTLHGLNETGDTPKRQFENIITNEGIEVFPDGFGGQWNDSTDMNFIDVLLTELQSEYCVDPSRVFAAGFSAGGGGTHAIGCYLGDRFRGIAALAGTGTFEQCEGRVAVMQIQGTSDFVAREEAAAAIREHWVAVNRCEDSDIRSASQYDRCESFVGCMNDYPTLYCEHSGGHEWPSWANPIIWDFFMGLEGINPGDDPEEGNDGGELSSVTFTLDIPADFEGVPRKLAPILYGPNTFQPIFVAPSLILNNGMPVGEEFVFGEEVQYEVSPINLAGLDLPADFTFTVVVYVEGGGDPTPCGKDWIGLQQVRIEDTGSFVLTEPLELEPFLAIPFFFDCPEP